MSAYDDFVKATSGLKQGESSIDDINEWWKAGHKVFRNDQEGFQQWSMENPEFATRWHSRAANKNVNTDWDNKKHQQMAQVHALQIANELGMGADMKENGKMIAFDYDTFKDVNSEWGAGDFWKIGTPQTLDKGIGAFLDNLDLGDVAMMAAPFLLGPLVGPAVAGMGLSPAMGAAVTSGLYEGLQGGDLKDILMGGGASYLGAKLPGILEGIKNSESMLEMPEWADDIISGAKDLYGDAKDIFGEFLPDFGGLIPGGATPGFGGGDWGDTFGSIGELFGGALSGLGGQGGPQIPAQGMMANPYEPTELAELNPMFQLQPLPHPVPQIKPTGMLS